MLRSFAATIRGERNIASLNPVERWNVDNITLSGTDVLSMNGLYNGFNLLADGTPQYDSSNDEIDTSSDSFLILDNFTEISSNQGELIAVVKYDPSAGSGFNAIFLYGIFASSRVLFTTTSNGFEIFYDAAVNRLYATAFNGVGYYIVSFVSTGSEYRIYLNDPVTQKTLTIVSGSNDGEWTDTVSTSVDNMSIGRLSAGAERPVSFKDQMYFNRLLTDDERTIVFNELNAKYSIY